MRRTETMEQFLEAFNRHDVDAIMAFFVDDCLFDTPRGPAPGGRRFVGKDAVREGIAACFAGIPDIRYEDDRHLPSADRGCSERRVSVSRVIRTRLAWHSDVATAF